MYSTGRQTEHASSSTLVEQVSYYINLHLVARDFLPYRETAEL